MPENPQAPLKDASLDKPEERREPFVPWRWLIFFVAAVLGLAADLGSKEWAFDQVELRAYGAKITVIPGFFDVALSENPGAAWGLLTGRHTFFLLISVAAFLAISYFVQTAPRRARLGPLVLGLVFAGVAGNFYDRCAGGVVRDFIDWHAPDAGAVHDLVLKVFGRTHWPTFNVADVFICVGAAAIVLVFWGEERRAKAIEAARVQALPTTPPPVAQPLVAPPAAAPPEPAK